jgi:hypothetical protein
VLQPSDGSGGGGGGNSGHGYPIVPAAGPQIKGEVLAFGQPAAVFLAPGAPAGFMDVSPLGLLPTLLSSVSVGSTAIQPSDPKVVEVGQAPASQSSSTVASTWNALTSAPTVPSDVRGSVVVPPVALSAPAATTTSLVQVVNVQLLDDTPQRPANGRPTQTVLVAASVTAEDVVVEGAVGSRGTGITEEDPAGETALVQATTTGFQGRPAAASLGLLAGYLFACTLVGSREKRRQSRRANSAVPGVAEKPSDIGS